MTLRNVIQALLMGMGVVGFILGVGTLEFLAEKDFGWFALVGAIIGMILLAVWLLLVARDNARDSRYPIVRYRDRRQHSIYDQYEKKDTE